MILRSLLDVQVIDEGPLVAGGIVLCAGNVCRGHWFVWGSLIDAWVTDEGPLVARGIVSCVGHDAKINDLCVGLL